MQKPIEGGERAGMQVRFLQFGERSFPKEQLADLTVDQKIAFENLLVLSASTSLQPAACAEVKTQPPSKSSSR
jgi:hypothetical protein